MFCRSTSEGSSLQSETLVLPKGSSSQSETLVLPGGLFLAAGGKRWRWPLLLKGGWPLLLKGGQSF